MRVRRARTSCDTSLTILALSLGERVVNHFARRCSRSALNPPNTGSHVEAVQDSSIRHHMASRPL